MRLYGHFGPLPPPMNAVNVVNAVNAVAIAPAVRFDLSSYCCDHPLPPPSSTSIPIPVPSSSPVIDDNNGAPVTMIPLSALVRRNELIRFRGTLVCLNTLESLKRLDKNAHLDGECLPGGRNTFGTSCFGEIGLKIWPDVFCHDNCDVNSSLKLCT